LTNSEFNVANLVELQLLENNILRKLNEINSLRKNPKLLKVQSEVESFNEKISEINKILTGLEHERKKLEDTIMLQNEKIKKNEEKLFSGTITSSKELVNYQEEIKLLRQNNDGLENKTLEKLMELDEYHIKIKDLNATLSDLNSEINSIKQDTEIKIKVIEDKVRDLRKRRSSVISGIPKDQLLKYEETKNKKSGIAVAVLQNNFCSICNMQIPASESDKIKDKTKVHKCPLCGRMLVIYSDEIGSLKTVIE
jgi:uncharacterized protein